MRRTRSAVVWLLALVGGMHAVGAEEPAAGRVADEALRAVAASAAPALLAPAVSWSLGAPFEALLGRLEASRRNALSAAGEGGASLAALMSQGGMLRLDLHRFRTQVHARRVVDSLAMSVWLHWGNVEAGIGPKAARAGFRGFVTGVPHGQRRVVGRAGRWVAALTTEARGSGAEADAVDARAQALVVRALEEVERRDAARSGPTIANAWQDPEVREAAFEDAVRAVEEACRAKFRVRPRYLVPTREELLAAMVADQKSLFPSWSEEDLTKALEPEVAALLGLYVPATHTLYVVPENAPAPSRVAVEVGMLGEPFMRVIFAHEVAHALDFERFAIHERRREAVRAGDEERHLALHAVCEGHAHWVAQKAAEAWGIPEGFAVALEVQGRTPDLTSLLGAARSLASARRMFSYAGGLAFFREVEEALGFAGVEDAFARLPTTLAEIDQPRLWLHPGAPALEVDAARRVIEPWIALVPSDWGLVGFRALRSGMGVHLALLPEDEQRAALEGYEGGHGFRARDDEGVQADATVFRFDGAAAAERFVLALRHVSEAKDRGWATGGVRYESAVYTELQDPTGARGGFRVTRVAVSGTLVVPTDYVVARSGRHVVELSLVDVSAELDGRYLAALASVLELADAQPPAPAR